MLSILFQLLYLTLSILETSRLRALSAQRNLLFLYLIMKKNILLFLFVGSAVSAFAQEKNIPKKNIEGAVQPAKATTTYGVTAPQSLTYPKGFEKDEKYGALYTKGEGYENINPDAEILDKRDLFSKHFLTSNGMVSAVVAAGRVHYLEDSLYKTILPNLERSNEEGIYAFVNPYNAFKTFYGKNSQLGTKILLNDTPIRLAKNQGVEYLDINYNVLTGHSFDDTNIQQQSKSKIYYPNVANGIDAQLEQNLEGYKSSYVLNTAAYFNNRPTTTKYIAFTENIELPNGWRVKYDVKLGESSIVFLDENNNKKIQMQRPVYFEKNRVNQDAESFGTYRFVQNGNNVKIQYLVNVDWLLNPNRNFPVIIDPTTTVFSTNTTASYRTGSVDEDSDCTGNSGADFRVGFEDGTFSNDFHNGYARFDITSIPDNACVFSEVMEFYQVSFTNPTSSDNSLKFYIGSLSPLTLDPVLGATTCRNIYDAINAGGFYQYWDVFSGYNQTSSAWKTLYTGNAANADITSCLAQNYYVIGLDYAPESHTDPSGDNNEWLTFAGSASANRPKLTVTYYQNNTAATGVTVGSPTICPGGSSTLTVSGGSLLDGTWTWYAGGCGSGSAIGTGSSISVSPTTTTTYYVRAENPCRLTTCASNTVTVIPLHTIALSSAAGTNIQTVCPSSAITNITYTVGGGANNATVSGLPSGVTGSLSGTTFTLSGTPTVSGSYSYTVSTTGNACAAVTATGTITVRPLFTYANLQFPSTGSICPSGSLTAYGQAYAAGVTEAAGAGAGVVAQIGYSTTNTNPSGWTNWSANLPFNAQVGNNDEFVGTLSGLAAGTYYYTFRYALNGCQWQYGGFSGGFWNGTTNVNGVLTVNPNHAIALTSAGATTTQTVCPNSAITNITYSVSGGGTGAGVTGLPSGVTGSFSGGVFTISGTPTVSGTYNYTVTTAGNACVVATATGTITVRPLLGFVNLQSPSSGTICAGASFSAYGQAYAAGVTEAAGVGAGVVAQIGYSTTNADPSTWTNWSANLPFNAQVGNNDEFVGTLSGLAAGTYYYAFRYTLNGCQFQYGGTGGFWATGQSGVLTVLANPTGGTIATVLACSGSTTAVASVTGATNATQYLWALPSGFTGISTGSSITLTGTPTVATTTNYTITVTSQNVSGGTTCNGTPVTGTITIYGTTITAGAVGGAATLTQCTGGNPGSFTAAAPSGGSGTYSYQWQESANCTGTWTTATAESGGSTSLSFDPPALNTVGSMCYRLLVTDANCTANTTTSTTKTYNIVADPAPPTATQSPASTNVCVGTTVTLTSPTLGAGGTGTQAFEYSITSATTSFSTTVPTITTVAGANNIWIRTTATGTGCNTSTATAYTWTGIAYPAAAATTNFSTVNCTNPTATLTATPATGVSYLWSNSLGTAATATVTPASGTTIYTVTVTTSIASCSAISTVAVTADKVVPILGTAVTNVLCFGGSTGAINLTVTGTSTPYTFLWSPGGAATEDIASLSANTYTVIVTGANGCTATTSATVAQPTSAVSFTAVPANATCNGTSTGSILVTASGGTAGYQYQIAGGSYASQTNPYTYSGLAATSYNVQVRDANGCTAATQNIPITQPTAVTISTSSTSPTCNGFSNGSVTVTVSGGTAGAGYTYSINNGATYPFASGATASGLTAITYNIIGKDGNGCLSAVTSLTLSAPATVAFTTTQVNVLCNGNTTGSITVTASGGSGAYTYSNNNGSTYTGVVSNPYTFSGLAATDYPIIVRDNAGCTSAASTITIAQPTAIALSIAGTTATCQGAATTVTASGSGGTGTITYAWSGGTPTNTAATSVTFAGGPTYTVTATDANSCIRTSSVTITNTNVTAAITAPATTVLTCLTTAISLTATGGTTYAWSGGTPTNMATTSVSAPTTYTVTATTNGCTSTSQIAITQSVVIPSIAITNNTGTTVLTCATTSISLTATTNAATPTYAWSGGTPTNAATTSVSAPTTYTVTVTNTANSCTASTTIAISQNLDTPMLSLTNTPNTTVLNCTVMTINLQANAMIMAGSVSYLWSTISTASNIDVTTPNIYTVVATSSITGCSATATSTITQNIALPGVAITNNTGATELTCALTSISLTATSATSGVTYEWNNPSTTGANKTVTAPNTYTVIATNPANTCTSSTTIAITQNITYPSLATAVTNVLCNGATTGAIDLTVTNGISPTYLWSPSGATTEDISGFAAATYSVVVTNSNGCAATTTATVAQPTAIMGSGSAPAILCNGGSATVTATASGGTPAYMYSLNGGAYQSGTTFGSISAGTYTLTIKDANLCIFNAANVTVVQPTVLVAGTCTLTQDLCQINAASVRVTVSGGTTPYIVTPTVTTGSAAAPAVQNIPTSGASTIFTNLTGGNTYQFGIRDANGCTL